MKTIIAGMRDYDSPETVERLAAHVHEMYPITEVISGGAKGVDRFGEAWAEKSGIPITPFPADWDKYGKSAGPVRNAEMASAADALLAVWDGESRGTRDMIRKAYKKDLRIWIYRTDQNELLTHDPYSDA